MVRDAEETLPHPVCSWETLINSARNLLEQRPMKQRPPQSMQLSFASYEFGQKKRVTRREKFLAEMEQVVPWARLEALIEPLYPASGRVGRPPKGVPLMLRMYFLQQWFGLADEALEDATYDSQSMREFTGIDLSRQAVP